MKFKKTVTLLFCSILLIVMCLPCTAFAAETGKFTLRVGYWQDYGMSMDASGKLSGYTYDYMKEIARFNNWNVEFISCNWSEGLELLKQGEIDVFGPLQKTLEREALYDYSSRSMGEEYGALYARSDNNTIFYEDAQSLNGKKCGMINNNYFLKILSDYCTQQQISVQTIALNDSTELDSMLTDGSIDLQVAGSLQIPNNSKLILRFDSEAFYYPTTKGNHFVLNGLNKALASIQKEDIYYNMQLYEKNCTQFNAEKKAFTAEEAAFIQKAPVLRVGYEVSGIPIEYYDETEKIAKGISIDMMAKISEYSGLQFEYVKTDDIEQAFQMVQDGELELVSNLVGCDDFSEFYHLEPTNPLMNNRLVFISKLGVSIQADEAVLSLPENWVGIRHHIENSYPEIEIVTNTDTEACLDDVLNGRAKMTVLNSYAAEKELNATRYRGLSVNNMREGEIDVCFGTAMDANPILRDILNKSIAMLDIDTRNQIIYQYTLALPYEPTLTEILSYIIPMLFIAITFFMVIIYALIIRSRNKLNRLAYYDSLTGEMNLNKFKLEAEKLIGHKDKTYALMVIDVDKFKSINDLYGYAFGDQLLVLITKVLRKTLLPKTILCHGVADKFYMFFEFISESWLEGRFQLLAENINAEIDCTFPECNVVLSGGACVLLPEDTNIISIIDRANIASKVVKNYHESQFAFYAPSMYVKLNQIHNIENDMTASLKHEEFIVYLQPKIKLTTKRIVGAEALIRWQHPERGLIQPGEFIPLFEKNGFIVNLDFYVLEQVCKLLERWKHEGLELHPISVNLSRRHLFHADTVPRLREIVGRYDVNPSLIELELTESAFENCNIPTIVSLFEELHTCGFTVSVDDFGTGYSSLSLLKDLPIDVLKIDKSFFECKQGCETDKMEILLESVISLSRRLNIKTVSEGVETAQQVNFLVRFGCDFAQGFYFAKPMPITSFQDLLQSKTGFDSVTV